MEQIIIKVAENDEVNSAIKLCCDTFSEKLNMTADDIRNILSDYDICLVAKIEENVIGAYLLKKRNIEPSYSDVLTEDLSYLSDKTGVEGLGLVVDKNYRGLSVGDKLKSFVKNLGFDYIFGAQYKNLNNIGYWEKSGRRVVGDGGDYFVTLEEFKKLNASLKNRLIKLSELYSNKKLDSLLQLL